MSLVVYYISSSPTMATTGERTRRNKIRSLYILYLIKLFINIGHDQPQISSCESAVVTLGADY